MLVLVGNVGDGRSQKNGATWMTTSGTTSNMALIEASLIEIETSLLVSVMAQAFVFDLLYAFIVLSLTMLLSTIGFSG